MGQLRRDYVLDKWVIIAEDRGRRPHQLKQGAIDKKVDVCYFCPGNENMTPPEIMRVGSDGGWQMRVFPNKFAAVTTDSSPEMKLDSPFVHSDNFGKHEVIVETPDHEKELSDLSPDDMVQLLKIYNERISEIEKMDGVEYVQVFKNHGAAAGTSLIHSHSQVIATNKVPFWVGKKVDAIYENGRCPYCMVIERESKEVRKIEENSTFMAFCPYASEFLLEAWIMPKRHVRRLDDLTDTELYDMALLLKKILARLREINAPFNYWIHYAPKGKEMHLQLIIAPRLALWAGFEFSGTIINSMSPEKAAAWYRGEE
ncbi:galactose-1-phosphate uridylyltransferase [Candidatus Woesearchaeota archaeon]|nr:galactose-1-phosphate uridylyltransferase [Candidatus Woesearchaeota archaeon]